MPIDRFGCVNSIINHSHGHGASELVKLHLMDSYCYPVPMHYAVECFNLPNSCIRQLNACYPRRARSALGVDTVLTLDVCLYVCMFVC